MKADSVTLQVRTRGEQLVSAHLHKLFSQLVSSFLVLVSVERLLIFPLRFHFRFRHLARVFDIHVVSIQLEIGGYSGSADPHQILLADPW